MILFMAVASFAFFDPFSLKANKEISNEKATHLFWLKDAKATSFIIRRDADVFQLECAAAEGCPFDGSGDWKLTQPVKDLADPGALGSVLSTMRALLIQEEIKLDTNPDPQEFGFTETKLAAEFSVKGEKEPYAITFGKPVPVGANVYATTNRQPHSVYLIANTVPSLLKGDLFHWRNKRLFPGTQADKLSFLSFSTRGNTVRAARGEQGWALTEPVKAPANSILLDGLMSTLSYTTAKSIYAPAHSDPSAQKVLQTKPILTASFGRAGETEFTFKVYAQPGAGPNAADYVAEASGLDPLFVVEGTPLERFQKAPDSYRDHRLFPRADLGGTDKLTLNFPRLTKTLTLERKSGAWVPTAGEPPAEPLSQKRVNAFNEALATIEAKDFGPAGTFAKTPADLELSISRQGKELAKTRFTVVQGKAALAPGDAENEVRRFGPEFLSLLPIRPQDLYESSNKQVVTKTPEAPHGHDHDHEHAH